MFAFTPLMCVFSPARSDSVWYRSDRTSWISHFFFFSSFFFEWWLSSLFLPAPLDGRSCQPTPRSAEVCIPLPRKHESGLRPRLPSWAKSVWHFNPVCVTYIFDICWVNNPGMHCCTQQRAGSVGLCCICCQWLHYSVDWLLLSGSDAELKWMNLRVYKQTHERFDSSFIQGSPILFFVLRPELSQGFVSSDGSDLVSSICSRSPLKVYYVRISHLSKHGQFKQTGVAYTRVITNCCSL